MQEQARLSELLALMDAISSRLANNGTTSGGLWIDVSKADRFLAIFNVGAIDTSATLSIEQATDSSGTNAKALKAATALGASDDNKQVLIDVRPHELDVANGFQFIRLKAVIGNGSTGANFSASLLSYSERYSPTSALQPASVAQVVN